ncbi:DUF4142 domain-containing protein [Bradyrhizobium tunisiense]|uniref:DUF4142 domain-containing protein n=1 Tax=Bradyrhizobium tunisiense TaxID=3278709 RepID=UPI0035E1A2A3
MRTVALAFSAMMAATFPAMAQNDGGRSVQGPAGGPVQAQDSSLSRGAQEFVNKVAMINMMEIEAAQAVQKRASSPAYEEFAAMIVTDHTNLGYNLKRIVAEISGLNVPAELDQQHRQGLTRLQQLQGDEFERRYRQTQIDGHRKAIRIFHDFADGSAGRADLRSWAQASQAVLQKHLQRAQTLPTASKQIGATTMDGNDAVRNDMTTGNASSATRRERPESGQ